MAANAVVIRIDDRTKRLSVGETLTMGSVYAVEVEGVPDDNNSEGRLTLSLPDGRRLAAAELAEGEGTLDLTGDEVTALARRMPFGAAVAVNAAVRVTDSGEEQVAGVGQVALVAAWQGDDET